ncbi:MAG TPA: hypothetical protein VFZ48_01910 [Candidatus Saccharimonadales bacterium]
MFKNSHAFSGFSVDNLATAKEFYGQTLGINVSEDAMGLTLHLAGGTRSLSMPKIRTHLQASRS